jgi:KilA-N domain
MAKQNIIKVDGTDIRIVNEETSDFISLTDIARRFNERTDQIITNWLRTRSTIEFLGVWETINNYENFNPLNFEGIKNQAGSPTFVLTVSDWVNSTNAIGIRAKAGRYGGTFAHRDIALEFASYLSPALRLYIIQEIQRLKLEENQTKGLQWNLSRLLSKVNYHIHTDAVKSHLIPARVQNTRFEGIIYATEADLLNLALFGISSREWQAQNPDFKGNIRDNASTEQLLVMANLENLNAEFIHQGLSKNDRLQRLNEIAIHQLELMLMVNTVKLFDSDDSQKLL